MRFIRSLPPAVDTRPFVARFLAVAKKSEDTTLFYITYQFFKQRGEVDSLACVEYKDFYSRTFANIPEDPTGLINGMEVDRPTTGSLSLASSAGSGFAATGINSIPPDQ